MVLASGMRQLASTPPFDLPGRPESQCTGALTPNRSPDESNSQSERDLIVTRRTLDVCQENIFQTLISQTAGSTIDVRGV